MASRPAAWPVDTVIDTDQRRARTAQVIEVLAGLVPASTDGPCAVLVDAGSGPTADFADRLAGALRALGRACVRLPDRASSGPRPADPAAVPADPAAGAGSADRGAGAADRGAGAAGFAADAGGGASGEDAVLVADGPGWRADPPAGRWDVVVYLRTPPPAGAGTGHGDGEHGADVAIDYHDPTWPVIRRVSPRLDSVGERIYLSETRAFFAVRAATWNTKFGDDLPAYAGAVAEAGIRPGATVVDAGCGTGRALPALRAAVGPGGTVVGLDLTPQMLATARDHRLLGGVSLLLGDARRLPLATARVDAVFAAGLVQHMPDPAAGLAELARVTRPGGMLIIFHPSGRAALAARHGRSLHADEPLHEPRLRALLDAAGWRLTRYDDPDHRFFALAIRGTGTGPG
jgi:SAM-dependent methyltransferase